MIERWRLGDVRVGAIILPRGCWGGVGGGSPTGHTHADPSSKSMLRAPSRGDNLSFLGVIGSVEKSPTG